MCYPPIIAKVDPQFGAQDIDDDEKFYSKLFSHLIFLNKKLISLHVCH